MPLNVKLNVSNQETCLFRNLIRCYIFVVNNMKDLSKLYPH